MLEGLYKAYKSFMQNSESVLKDFILKKVDGRYLAFGRSLSVYGMNEDEKCIYLSPYKRNPLYCVYLSSPNNLVKKFRIFKELVLNYGYEDNAEIIVFYTKSKMTIDGASQDFCTKQGVYLFTPLRNIAEELSYYFKAPLATCPEIIDALLDIGLISTYENDEDTFEILSNFNKRFIPEDDLAFGFKSLFTEGVYGAVNRDNPNQKGSHTLYQGLGVDNPIANDREPFISDMMTEDWNGYIAISFDFSKRRVDGHIRQMASSAKTYETNSLIKKKIKKFKEDTVDGNDSSLFCLMNVVAVIDNPLAINKISSHLEVRFIEKKIWRKDIIYNTLLQSKDSTFSSLATINTALHFIQGFHKTHNAVSPKDRDMYGVDIFGNYISHSLSETGGTSHFTMAAPSRSGKTFAVLMMLAQVLGAKIVPNPEKESLLLERGRDPDIWIEDDIVESCRHLGAVKVVHFDIGYSALAWAKAMLNAYPEQAVMYDDDFDNLRFGITDIRYDYKENKIKNEDLSFSVGIINLLLEVDNEKPLSALESVELEESMKRVFYEDTYVGMEIIKLRGLGGYDDILDKLKAYLIERGDEWDEYRRTTEYNLRDTPFEFLQKPTFSDIVRDLTGKTNNLLVKEHERDLCMDTIKKVKIVEKNPIFAYYSKSNIVDSDYFYMELETIKTLGEKIFIPVFVAIFQKLYRRDLLHAQKLKGRNQVPPKIFYIIEEFHNFKKYTSLLNLFDVILRESARYGMQVGFISQSVLDFPDILLNNVDTRIIMPSETIKEQDLKRYWSEESLDGRVMESPCTDFYLERKKRFYMFIYYIGNIITMKPYVDKSHERLFNSNPMKVKDDDE